MKLLLFATVTTLFILLTTAVHYRFFGRIRERWLGTKFDWIPLAELLIFICYAYWAFHFLFGEKTYYPVMILGLTVVVLVVPIIFILKDFIPGMAFRTDTKLRPGIQVELNKEKAEITKLGMLRMTLKAEKGNMQIVPYSKIRSFSYLGDSVISETEYYSFQFTFSDLQSAHRSIDKIKNSILTSPWLPAGTDPRIQLLNKPGQAPSIEVHINAISSKHARLIEVKIKELISDA